MKKILAILLSTLMLFALVACGNGDDNKPADPDTSVTEGTPDDTPDEPAGDDEEEIVTGGTTGGGDTTLRLAWLGSGQDKDKLDSTLQKYTDSTGTGVETVFIPGSWGEYFTKMQTMTAGGDILDNAFVAIEGFEMFVDMGLAAPIDDWIAENQEKYDKVANDVDENVLGFMNFDGKQYGIPMEWNNIVVHMNKQLFEEAGVDIPDSDWTIDEFLEICDKLTVEREDGTKQYAVAAPSDYFGRSAWLFSNGASYYNDDFTESNLTSPETVEVFQLCQDLVYEYGYAPIGEEGVDMIQQLIDGNVAMGFWGRWPTTKYEASDFKDVAIQVPPKFKESKTVWGGASIFTMSTTKSFDDAADLSIYIASPVFIEEFMEYGAIPVLNSVASKLVPALGYPDNNNLYWETASISKPVESPAQYAELENIISRASKEIQDNQADVLETLTAVEAEVNAILSENK